MPKDEEGRDTESLQEEQGNQDGSNNQNNAAGKPCSRKLGLHSQPNNCRDNKELHAKNTVSIRRNIKKVRTLIPEDITTNEALIQAVNTLPSNYNFEIFKSIWRLRKCNSKRVALQFPEGLLMYACTIADILEQFTPVEVVVMGDVVYGACCVDDYSARAMGCDFLIHYGHSCLVPIDTARLNMLYVFVSIDIDVKHFIETLQFNFKPNTKLALVSTVQFAAALQAASEVLSETFDLSLPQVKPLSPGEILGCTSPRLSTCEAIVYLGDGRFHLESIMIHNPEITAYRYDPYCKIFSVEGYDIEAMKSCREKAISTARGASSFGLIMGTLGHQGSILVLKELKKQIEAAGKTCVVVLLSEITPEKLKMFSDIKAWVQIACPRLSIDWGYAFDKPILTPYELSVALARSPWRSVYPMDYYANDSLGPWTPNHTNSERRGICFSSNQG